MRLTALLAALAVWAGCSPSKSSPPATETEESWSALFIGGIKAGYDHTVTTPIVEQGQPGMQVAQTFHLLIDRDGKPSELDTVVTSVESPDGQLLRFRTELQTGPDAIVITGKLREGRMEFETVSTGETTSNSIAWPAGTGGFTAPEESLRKRPMQPGDKRTVRGLISGSNEVARIDLIAGRYEPTRLLSDSQDLLRIELTTTLPSGPVVRSTVWTDRSGRVMKAEFAGLQMVGYRTTREIALADNGPVRFDMIRSTTIPVNRQLAEPDGTRRIRYRVHLDQDDPSKVFAFGPTQRIKSIDPHTAEIVVRAIRPGDPPDASGKSDDWPKSVSPPTDEDRRANNLLQSDDPRIVALAKEAAGSRTDPWDTAVALEKFVHQYIAKHDASNAFSTAVEVAESRAGICTQHAVLLAALARARGIPARVAIGLVYIENKEGKPGFAFHLWNEVWIGDRWIPIDGIHGKGGTGAAYLKLADSSLSGEAAYSCFLPVAQVIGQAKIEILDSQ